MTRPHRSRLSTGIMSRMVWLATALVEALTPCWPGPELRPVPIRVETTRRTGGRPRF